jgi:hypothetical protein
MGSGLRPVGSSGSLVAPVFITRGVLSPRGAFSPADLPNLTVDLSGEEGPNLVEMRGSDTGFYAYWVSDTCAIITNGQVNANSRWSPFNNISALIGGRAYNVGASDDYEQNAARTFALFLAESNHVNLDYFQGFLSNEGGYRFAIGRFGEQKWSDGVVGAPTEPDMQCVHDAPNQLTWQIGVAHANALRISEPAAGELALLVRRNTGGVFSLERLSQAGVDTAGAGFRMVRIPN